MYILPRRQPLGPTGEVWGHRYNCTTFHPRTRNIRSDLFGRVKPWSWGHELTGVDSPIHYLVHTTGTIPSMDGKGLPKALFGGGLTDPRLTIRTVGLPRLALALSQDL